MYLRLHLRVLLDLESSPTQLPSLLSHAVETWCRPIINTHKKEHLYTFSGIYNPSMTIQPFASFRPRLLGVCLWWTWAESNRRPTCLRFEGITTILYLRFLVARIAASRSLFFAIGRVISFS